MSPENRVPIDPMVSFMKNLGKPHELPGAKVQLEATKGFKIGAAEELPGASGQLKSAQEFDPTGAREQLKASKEFPQPTMFEKKDPGQEERDYLERQLSYERFVEDAKDRINSTTLPWEVRMAVRDTVHQFIDAPPGLGDNYGLQGLYNFLASREKSIQKIIASEPARQAIGLDEEPWRDTSLINRQDKLQLEAYLIDNGVVPNRKEAQIKIKEKEIKAKERAPYFCEELLRSRDELALNRKLTFLWWGWKNAASGQEVGNYYMENKIPSLPTPKDFAKLLQTPSYFVSEDENLKKGDTKKAKDLPGYPEKTKIEAFLKVEKRSTENEPLGRTIEKEMRIMYTVALGDSPERLMEWKFNAEKGVLNKILEEKGVNPAYLILRDKGIDYHDSVEDEKIQNVINGLTEAEKDNIKNAWWKQQGFDNETAGKDIIGDPEMWIPTKARRGDPKVGAILNSDSSDRQTRVDQIKGVLLSLKKDWQDLSPLNNHTSAETTALKLKIENETTTLRNLATLNENGKLSTIIPTLPIENELGVRGTATKLGCVWARVQLAEGKEELFSKTLPELAGGDKLAFEMAEATIGVFGIPAKWGYNMRDYNPSADPFSDDEWKVDVEAWPYTSEFQNIMALDKYSRYKAEAFGPDGSRNRFGPLMTDYLTANMIRDYDQNGNELFVIVDEKGTLRKGRADEGLVITDTSRTLLQEWEKGASLSEESLWRDVQEDPFRRFLLRSFFAEGQSALGPSANPLMDIWRKKEIDLSRDLNEKFLDAYKLSRRVALKSELDKEPIWKDVVDPIDSEYKTKMANCLTRLNQTTDLGIRQAIMKEYSSLYAKWSGDRWKEVFDYVDQTWWNGVMSTHSCVQWDLEEIEVAKEEVGMGGKFNPDRPSRALTNFARKAKERGINLFGKYSIDKKVTPVVMNEARKIFEPRN